MKLKKPLHKRKHRNYPLTICGIDGDWHWSFNWINVTCKKCLKRYEDIGKKLRIKEREETARYLQSDEWKNLIKDARAKGDLERKQKN